MSNSGLKELISGVLIAEGKHTTKFQCKWLGSTLTHQPKPGTIGVLTVQRSGKINEGPIFISASCQYPIGKDAKVRTMHRGLYIYIQKFSSDQSMLEKPIDEALLELVSI